MNTGGIKSWGRISSMGWGILLTINALLIVNSVLLYVFIASESMERTISILLAGSAFFGLALAQDGYRSRSKGAWKLSWIMVALLWAVGINISLTGELYVGVFYLFLAGAVSLGQIMAGRDLNPASELK
jgi:hypothetical protein